MAMNKVVSIVRADGEGEKLWFYGGGVHTWKATSAGQGRLPAIRGCHDQGQGDASPPAP